jgi:multiple sugar transport system permease protein
MQRWTGYGPQRFVGFDNVAALAGDPVFRTSLLHSALWDLGSILVATPLSLLLALVISQSRRPSLFLSVLFFPALLPATVLAAVAALVLSPLTGPLNSALSAFGLGRPDWLGDPHLALLALFAIWLWSAVGVGTVILWAALRAVGRDYQELALVEGAGRWWRLRHVTLPATQRSLAVVAAVEVALASQSFDLVFVTTGGGPGYATMLLPLDMYGRAFGGHAGEGATVACAQLVLLLSVLLALLLPALRAERFDVGERASRLPAARFAVTTALGVFSALFLLPFAWLPLAALQPGRSFALAGPSFDPSTWTLGNLTGMWSAGMGGALATSALLACGAVALTLGLATPAAFALARQRRGRWVIISVLALGLLQPTTVILLPLFSLLRSLHLLDTLWGVLLPEATRSLPFALLVTWAFLSGLPRELLDAAEVDGASPFQQLTRLALPLARPALFAAGVWTFVTSWNEYLLPTIVSQNGSITTVPTILASFAGTFDTQLGPLAAGSALAMLPAVIVLLVLRSPAASGLERAGRNLQ